MIFICISNKRKVHVIKEKNTSRAVRQGEDEHRNVCIVFENIFIKCSTLFFPINIPPNVSVREGKENASNEFNLFCILFTHGSVNREMVPIVGHTQVLRPFLSFFHTQTFTSLNASDKNKEINFFILR